MVTLFVIIGSGEARGIVPVTEKLIVDVPVESRIAWRKDPGPESLVFVTVMDARAEEHRRADNRQKMGSLRKLEAFITNFVF
jgi:hypothetical protein